VKRQGRRRRGGIVVPVSAALLVALVLVAVTASWISPYDPLKQNLASALLPPGSTGSDGYHLLGTDELGRDTLSRLMHGFRPIAVIATTSTIIATTVGSGVGLVAGLANRLVESLGMRMADIQLSVPPVILAIILAVALKPGMTTAIVAIALVTWPQYARVVRAETARVRQSEYVRLARVAGVSGWRLVRWHVLPNIVSAILVLATLNLSIAIIFSASLSFLGVGVQAPSPDWGNMLAGGTQYLQQWWLVVFPGLAITIVVLALNFLGDHVRDLLDPRMAAAGDEAIEQETLQMLTESA
jgi:peptide/nickel transport system permease protein